MLSASLKSELDHLSLPDKLEAFEVIRNSIAPPDGDFPELTSGQKAELLRRAKNAAASPEQGSSWEEVKQRLLGG